VMLFDNSKEKIGITVKDTTGD